MPEAVKRRRNNELLAIQNAVSLDDNWPYQGRTVEILVEGASKAARKKAAAVSADSTAGRPHPNPLPKGEGTEFATAGRPHPNPLPKGEGTVQLVGRTVCDRIVVFDGPRELTGRIVSVRIDKVDAFTLFGSTVYTVRLFSGRRRRRLGSAVQTTRWPIAIPTALALTLQGRGDVVHGTNNAAVSPCSASPRARANAPWTTTSSPSAAGRIGHVLRNGGKT